MNDSFQSITRVLLFVPLISSGVVRIVSADPQRAGAVEQAKIDRQQIRFPIVDRADIRFMRFYTIEGPSKSNAGPFAQDDQGFVWFGTPYGLNRFDGYNFKVFTHDPGNPKSISGSLVTALFKDRDGVLWVGCNHLLNRFDRETETFTRYPVPDVFHISQDAAGTLWFSTPTGLYSLDRANGNVRRYAHDPNDPTSLESNNVKSAGEDKNGQFWVATSEGLDSFDRWTGKVRLHVPLKEASYPFSFYEDRFGVFWIYHVSGNGLAIFDREKKTLTEFSFREPQSSSAALSGITGMLEDKSGELWLSTNGAGLLRFDREHRRFIRYSQRLGDPESLVQNSIRDLFADREGVIWASLGGYGLTRFTSKPLPFKRYRHDFGNPSDHDEPFVGAIYEDDDGVLWIGTHSALHRIDRSSGKFQDFELTRGESSDVITMCQDRSGYLWVGTFGHGLFRFDPRSNQVKRFRHDPADPQSLSSDIVTRVFIDHNGTLWVATHDGLDRYDAAAGGFTTYKVESQGVHPHYLGLAEDRRGILWLGTESTGLLRFDPATGRFTIYQHNPDNTHTLSDNRVNSVHFDRSGTMWVGAQQGLNQFDESTGTFTNYSLKEGLPGSAVACILEDDDGYLWMSTDNGLAKFDPKTKKVKSYSTADGLPGPDLTGWGTCSCSKKGEMFFGGFSGATAFFPKHVSDSSYVPQVALTDFRLFGAGVLPGADSPLKKTINHTDAITLSHEQNRFSIGFSALSYLSPTTNRYRYMLERLDTQWNEVGSDQRFASYTTLPVGTYTFRVQGATSRGPWSEPGATLRLEILPAWWNTWWFRSVWVALSVTLLWAFHQWRVQRLQQQEKMLREAIETIPTAAWITRPDGSNEFVNRRWVEYTGLSGASTRGSGWQVAVHPEDLDRHVDKWGGSLASGEPLEDEVRFRRGTDSEYRWFLVRAVPLRDKRGNILNWYGVTTDIEDRKRAEEERQRLLKLEADLAAKIRRLVDANIVGVMITNLEGQIIEANDAFLGIVGYSREDLASGGLRWTDLTPSEWQPATQRAVAQIYATGSCDLYEKEYARKDGSRVPVLVASAAIGNAESECVAFVLDLSERKAAESEVRRLNQQLEQRIKERTAQLAEANRQLAERNEELARVSRMKSEFLASMSDDLRTPLNSIAGFSDLLAEEGEGPLGEVYSDYVQHVKRGAQHLLDL
ncbi:MAG TPA: two-component regulator propeller domain-containing protein, partial [Bryobacteraceae bacterium]|nr:two-component regulator propeller domain-containing protein [Bryobacteraceae bacterium]